MTAPLNRGGMDQNRGSDPHPGELCPVGRQPPMDAHLVSVKTWIIVEYGLAPK